MTDLSQPDQDNISSRTATGAVWTVGIRLAINILAFSSQLILARLLLPEDFGLVAVAGIVASILEAFGQFGFEISLIQRQTTDRSYYDSAWTMNVMVGLVTALLLLLLAHPTALFFEDHRVSSIVICFAFAAAFRGFSNIGTVEFQKHLDFRREFIFLILQKSIGFVVTIPLAIIWRNYWALVAGMVAFYVFGTVLSYRIHSFRPRFSFVRIRELFKFSRWLVLNNVLNWLDRQGRYFFIGKLIGIREVGLYGMASQITGLATHDIAQPIARALFPGLAIVAGNQERLIRGVKIGLSGTMTLVIPAGLGLAYVADLAIPILLGDRWAESAMIVEALAVAAIFQAIFSTAQSAFLATGKPQLATRLLSIQALALVSLLVPALMITSLDKAVWAIPIAQFLGGIIALGQLSSTFGLTVITLLQTIWRQAISGTIMIACLFGLDIHISGNLGGWRLLTLQIVWGCIVYVVALLATWRAAGKPEGAEKSVIEYLTKFRRNYKAPLR